MDAKMWWRIPEPYLLFRRTMLNNIRHTPAFPPGLPLTSGVSLLSCVSRLNRVNSTACCPRCRFESQPEGTEQEH